MTVKFEFPPLPECKTFKGIKSAEQLVMEKCANGEDLTVDDELILKEAIEFYKVLIAFLKTIPLDKIDLEDATTIIEYLRSIFNQLLIVDNDVGFSIVYRVSRVKNEFLETDKKVHHPKYLREPGMEIIKRFNIFNRCSSFNHTLFYAAFKPEVAIMEIKPKPGERIIVSTWLNHTNKEYITFNIPNTNVKNDSTTKANKGYREFISKLHPLVAKLLDVITLFQSEEFSKNVPIINKNSLEYLFSSFFSDTALHRKAHDPGLQNPEMILYPSVACNHKEENIAMVLLAARNLKLIEAIECEVVNTYYDKALDFEKGEKPADLKEIKRANTWIYDDNIVWNDD